MTPEGRVKSDIKKVLHHFGIYPAGSKVWKQGGVRKNGWYYMPVQNGMGTTGIHDFVCCIWGRFVSIEAKAPGKTMTPNQTDRMNEIQAVEGVTILIDDAVYLADWFVALEKETGRSFL